MYKTSGRKARWKDRVLDRSLSSDLCHDRCACMAGQKNISIKNSKFLVLRGDSMGYFWPGVSPPVRCALSVFVFLFCLSILLAANRKQSDVDSGQLQMHRYLASKDDSREVGCWKLSSRGVLIARMKFLISFTSSWKFYSNQAAWSRGRYKIRYIAVSFPRI